MKDGALCGLVRLFFRLQMESFPNILAYIDTRAST